MKETEPKFKISWGPGTDKNRYRVVMLAKDKYPADFKSAFKDQIDAKIFTGDSGSQLTDETNKTIYIGIGEEDKVEARKLAALFLKLGESAGKWHMAGLEIVIPKFITDRLPVQKVVYHIATSLQIGAFALDSLSKKFRENKTKNGKVTISTEDPTKEKEAKKGIEKSEKVSPHVNGARHISHLPANVFDPDAFEKWSRALGKEHKLKITVLDESRLKKEKMGGILSVGHGSSTKARIIILEYNPPRAKKEKLAIIGKGLTFDSGGISIKPAAEMHEMKYDMCGAATTVHAIAAIAELKLPVSVVAAIGVVENMPDASATKPGDVYTAYNGLTVEVQNTDAEGRLVLGDVLSYIGKKYKPQYMVDLATLTGAVLVALGNEAAAVIGNSDEFVSKLKDASASSDERIWELPNWEEFGEGLKSDIADIRNITSGRGAGTISAANFLSRFVEPKIKWVHLDIAGTAWRKGISGTQCSGPTGFGVRLLVDLAEKL